jgi:hypothetical protein
MICPNLKSIILEPRKEEDEERKNKLKSICFYFNFSLGFVLTFFFL